MEGSGFVLLPFNYVKFSGLFHTKENPMPTGKLYTERDETLLRKSKRKKLQSSLRLVLLRILAGVL